LSSSDNLNSDSDFGANEWLVAEMYGQWLANPDSVDKSWWPILERYQLTQQGQPAAAPAAQASFDDGEPTTGSLRIIDTDSTVVQTFDAAAPAPQTEAITVPVAKTSTDAPETAPVPANLPPVTGSIPVVAQEVDELPEVNILRGMAKTLASNMDASLSIPTATSVRQVPAKLLIDNRIVINSHLKRTRGGKVSFTHLIGYAKQQSRAPAFSMVLRL
jgi:2-oxoglutarate dehydrogenase E1 component